jgi:hypothetical protein
MKLAILKIILWPKNPELEPRVISFEPNKINVITGESGAGKSALTWITDYCLGSEKCSIPVGLIREVTGWFGLHLKLANTEMVVARRNPEDQQSTSDIYWNEGLNLEIPRTVAKNARVEDLKHRFNQISYLPSLDFAGEENAGRASFRDMAAFNFQPQHIVANPFTLFFKADTTDHREKLRVIFPLALGVIDANVLAKQRELKDLSREHDRLARELEARLKAARAWENEIGSYYLQARSLGLLPDSPAPGPEWGLEKFMLELQKVPVAVREMDLPGVEEGTNEASIAELTKLVNEEDELSQTIGATRRRLAKLDQLAASVDQYSQTLVRQDDRMQSVGWLESHFQNRESCPICNSPNSEGNTALSDLQTLASQLKSLTASVDKAPAKLDYELANLRQEMRDYEGQLSRVRAMRKGLEDSTATLATQRQRVRQIYLFVGRIEQALENASISQNVSALQEEVNNLSRRIKALHSELDPFTQRNRLDAAIEKISRRIEYYAKLLRLEHSSENVRLNLRELTLQFSALDGRKDYLWEVGSGKNWVGYHIAVMLSLHEHFLARPHNPVPRFLFIDQPSQVYFPETWPASGQDTSEEDLATISSDIEGVLRIFHALSEFMTTVDAEFQIIVTEHAGPITWKGVSHINVVGNWRTGHDEFLIPESWIN